MAQDRGYQRLPAAERTQRVWEDTLHHRPAPAITPGTMSSV